MSRLLPGGDKAVYPKYFDTNVSPSLSLTQSSLLSQDGKDHFEKTATLDFGSSSGFCEATAGGYTLHVAMGA